LSTHWPNGQISPKQCNTAANPGSDTADCAYDYGWNAATDSYADAVNAYVALGWAPTGSTRTPVANAWWLDVETANSWTSNTTFNVDALQGEVDYLHSVGNASVGFYSTSADWQVITGGTSSFAAYPSWIPGASSLSEAQANCTGGGVTGGGVALTQYPSNGFDGDYRCGTPSPSPSLSFTSAPQTLTAGSPSGPMSVALSQSASSTTSVTLSSSSTAGGFATGPGGPWGSTLTLSVPAGATSSGSFYYRDTRAGHPLLSASASGYSDATQTETVNPAALATIAVSPTTAQVRLGGQSSFSATGQDQFGNAVSVTPWWSVAPALGTFSANPGNPVSFVARSSGSGTITASVGGVLAKAAVTVTRRRSSQLATSSGVAAPRMASLISLPSGARCLSGQRLAIRARRGTATGLLSVRLLIDGKPVKTLRSPALATGTELRLPAGRRHTLTIVAFTGSGRKITLKYSYRSCAKTARDRRGQPPTLLPARPGG
jgi:hypothetical protein